MSEHDPIDDAPAWARFRAANPVRSDAVPDGNSPAAAAVLEEILRMPTDSAQNPAPSPARQRTTWWLAAAAVLVVALLGVGALALVGDDDPDEGLATPTTPPGFVPGEDDPRIVPPPGGAAASCVETYDLASLGDRERAFDGTVSAVEGSVATFEVHRWFRGGDGPTTTAESQVLIGGPITPGGDVQLVPGQRFLVSGDSNFAWACGFTRVWTESEAAAWAEVFGV